MSATSGPGRSLQRGRLVVEAIIGYVCGLIQARFPTLKTNTRIDALVPWRPDFFERSPLFAPL
ncbi:MAG: hypothetical protein OQK94_06505, partial [Gammaproteobacteria bacterium]|nr:hypothetical protein [Gammaproteobacteria bacterium]